MELLLAPGVFACEAQQHTVFLDLRRDRYFALSTRQTALLNQVTLADATQETRSSAEDAQIACRLAETLERQGLTTRDRAWGRPAVPIEALPGAHAIPERLDDIPILTLREILRFYRCAARAAYDLRLRAMESVVASIARRKSAVATGAAIDASRLVDVARTYSYLRPLAFGSRERCLMDALTLMYYLTSKGIAASWVFGVKLAPFQAHCWVQCGEFILNDTPEHVDVYSPIMIV